MPIRPALGHAAVTAASISTARWYAAHLVCERNGGRGVVAVPIEGCAFWMRAIGSDDELRGTEVAMFNEAIRAIVDLLKIKNEAKKLEPLRGSRADAQI